METTESRAALLKRAAGGPTAGLCLISFSLLGNLALNRGITGRYALELKQLNFRYSENN